MSSLVPKLTLTNFHTWYIQMKALLMVQGLWPIAPKALTSENYLSATTGNTLQNRWLKLPKHSSRVCGILLQHISDELILGFFNTDDPYVLWDEIRQNYLERLPDSEDLMNQFDSVLLVNEGTVEAYIAKLRKLYLDLEMVCGQDEMNDVSLPVQVLAGLPGDWKERCSKLVEEREEEGHSMMNTVTGYALRVQDEERARRGIGVGMPLFAGGVYAAEVCGQKATG